MRKRITILGATGSVGRNTLRVIEEHPEQCAVAGLAVHSNIEALYAQIQRWHPPRVAVWDAARAAALRQRVDGSVTVLEGADGLQALATDPACDVVMAAMSGVRGLEPLLAAIAAGKTVAVANKESLVMAGELVMAAVARAPAARLIPVDSEHSAIFQCLASLPRAAVEHIYITGSGGPLWRVPAEALATVDHAQVLHHPRWSMGPKITVDSATLMNKGLEIIEAHWLFACPLEQLSVVIHPEAAIHGMVTLIDGTLLSAVASCDMRIPIQYALSHPERWTSTVPRVAWDAPHAWNFAPPDVGKFPCLRMAMQVAEQGQTMPAILNAANEVAVEAFLQHQMRFIDIATTIEHVLARATPTPATSLDVIQQADAWARDTAQQYIGTRRAAMMEVVS